tara:strand:- start:75 stop:578 length:504 start_codon:yes stop_codon:yes gene_type:complete
MINSYYSDILGLKKGGSSEPKYSVKKEVKDRLKKENPKTSFLMIGLSPVTQYRKFKHRQNIKKERARDEAKTKYSRGGDVMPKRNKKNFRPTEKGAGMTEAGVAAYRRANPGSKLKTAVTGKVKPGSKAAKRRKSYCARSAGQMKKFPKAAKDPNSRLRQARRRWKC